jgi:4-hydroxybenzoate polyprenyltransferase/phosphoserine phosphatase
VPPTPEHPINRIPLCVDLDGTLVNTDTLIESALLLAKINPLYVLAMFFWLLFGKAHLKEKIAVRTALDVTTLPYNSGFLEWLIEQRETGRELVLVTASNQRIADAVAGHLQIFSRALGSSADHNLAAKRKREELDRLFGKGGYDYAGNSRDDLQVWSSCRKTILVNAGATLSRHAKKNTEIEAVFPRKNHPFKGLVSAMRPHQWTKNLLVFVSILIAHHYTDIPLLQSTVIAFLSFCLCSSAVYLINDLLDLEADRGHSEKCNRAFASGKAPLMMGIAAAPVLLMASIFLARIAGPNFVWVLAIYFAVTLVYSFYLKRLVLLDVLVLATLYTIRIIAGASVAAAVPSVWLVTFSMFIFTSLAMAKRYAELKSLELEAGDWVSGRGYRVSDIPILAQLGAASGYISTLVLALYIDSVDVAAVYQNQHFMWLLCPLLMYWIGRIWLVASRGDLHHDPVVFATRDRVSYLVFVLGLVALMAAR